MENETALGPIFKRLDNANGQSRGSLGERNVRKDIRHDGRLEKV